MNPTNGEMEHFLCGTDLCRDRFIYILWAHCASLNGVSLKNVILHSSKPFSRDAGFQGEIQKRKNVDFLSIWNLALIHATILKSVVPNCLHSLPRSVSLNSSKRTHYSDWFDRKANNERDSIKFYANNIYCHQSNDRIGVVWHKIRWQLTKMDC